VLIIQKFLNLYMYKKNKVNFIYMFILSLYIIFYNTKYNYIINNDVINLKLWKYIYILNNNNNSILFIKFKKNLF